jgi:hypothetical protein
VELPSILDWKMHSGDTMEPIYQAHATTVDQVKELTKQLKPGDYTVWDLICFHYLQLIPGVLNANTHAAIRTTELLTQIQVLNIRLEALTKWLIGLTVALVILTIVLLIATVRASFHA